MLSAQKLREVAGQRVSQVAAWEAGENQKRRLSHSRLRLTVIVVVCLVGCVCVVLIVALERDEGGEKEREVQGEACSWIMNVKVSLKYHSCAKADTLPSCQSNRNGHFLCWQRSCSKVNKPVPEGEGGSVLWEVGFRSIQKVWCHHHRVPNWFHGDLSSYR